MKAAFWRFAHSHYQTIKPLVLAEVALFVWFTFFAIVYGCAVRAGWLPTFIETVVGIMLVVSPLALGLLHRRIRIEAAKGPDALYRKRIAASDLVVRPPKERPKQ